jgi:hypothetical protein
VKVLFRILALAILLFVSVDIVKNISPDLCSRPGHYHFIKYGNTTSYADSRVQYQSGRPLMHYSGGKNSCEQKTPEGFEIAVFLYGMGVELVAFLPSLPAWGCEVLIGNGVICRIMRYINTLAVAAYLLIVLTHYAIAGRLVLDLSMDEIDAVKKVLPSRRKTGGQT